MQAQRSTVQLASRHQGCLSCPYKTTEILQLHLVISFCPASVGGDIHNQHHLQVPSAYCKEQVQNAGAMEQRYSKDPTLQLDHLVYTS